MKINEILQKDNISLSFEVFPPKNDTVFEEIKTATEKIAQLKPSFISVTYGAGGGTSKYTLEIAKNIEKNFSVPTLAHLTCISSRKETVLDRIKELKEANIKNIMALRGDIPFERQNDDRSTWDFRYAVELIKETASHLLTPILFIPVSSLI